MCINKLNLKKYSKIRNMHWRIFICVNLICPNPMTIFNHMGGNLAWKILVSKKIKLNCCVEIYSKEFDDVKGWISGKEMPKLPIHPTWICDVIVAISRLSCAKRDLWTFSGKFSLNSSKPFAAYIGIQCYVWMYCLNLFSVLCCM